MRHLLLWGRTEGDRVLGFVLLATAGILVVATYGQVSGTSKAGDALSYLASSGIGGLFLLGFGLTLLLSADFRDTWRQLDGLEQALPGDRSPERDTTPLVSARTAAATLAGIGLGVILVVAGWIWASSTSDTDEAFSGLAVAVAGVVVIAAAVGGFLTSLHRRLRGLKDGMTASFGRATAGGSRRVTAGTSAGTVLVGEGLTRFHRPGCAALAYVAVQSQSVDRVAAGFVACRLCHEDDHTRSAATHA